MDPTHQHVPTPKVCLMTVEQALMILQPGKLKQKNNITLKQFLTARTHDTKTATSFPFSKSPPPPLMLSLYNLPQLDNLHLQHYLASMMEIDPRAGLPHILPNIYMLMSRLFPWRTDQDHLDTILHEVWLSSQVGRMDIPLGRKNSGYLKFLDWDKFQK